MIDRQCLPPEAMRGLLLNLPHLEAKADLRQMMAMGATLGGKEGRDYLEHIIAVAHHDSPDLRDKANHMLTVVDAIQGRCMASPPENEGTDDGSAQIPNYNRH